MLTRNQMEEVIRSGGSVLHGGRLITRVEHLPTDADLAAGNPEQEALAAAALEAQIAALQAQRDRLAQAKVPQSERAPAVAPMHVEPEHNAKSMEQKPDSDKSVVGRTKHT
jgi:predicted HD phosphohydrolase